MNKIMPMLVCLVALLALGLLIARVTDAEGGHAGVATMAEGRQGGNFNSTHNGAISGNLTALAPLGASPTPTPPCAVTYTYTVSAGAPVTATNRIGGGCRRCGSYVSLPFPFTFYGQTYNHVEVESQGNIQFTG